MYFGLFQASAFWQRDALVIGFLMCGNNFCSGSFCGGFDPAVGITFTPIVARVVKDRYFTCPSIKALFNNFLYKLRIGVRGQFRCLIPSYIRFYTDSVALADEALNSSHFSNGFAKHGFGLTAQHGNHVVLCCSICSLKRLSEYAHRIRILDGGDGCTGKSNGFQEISSVHNVFNLLFVL
jgi:hypothetical protein